MNQIVSVKGMLENGKIVTEVPAEEIVNLVKDEKIVVIKKIFPEEEMLALRREVVAWGKENAPVNQDNFKANYHCLKVKISNIQKVPHVFHDYNFNDFGALPIELKIKLSQVFECLRIFYNQLTGYDATLGVKENAPYFHPQLIQYPSGGGFFGRHSHNLLPQKIGLILSMAKYGNDYSGGGTCFVANDKVVDLEGHHDIGDLCLFRFDIDHWVKQSPLDDKFNWDDENGRWVATLAYFDPFS